MMESFHYTFPAIRGIQAGKEYYLSICPMKLIPKIFLFNEVEVDPKLRAQRVLNKSRVPEIASYLVNNPTDYVLSALTASIDAEVKFEPAISDPDYFNIGHIHIPMSARIVINDGQHRRAAIEVALKRKPTLAYETVPVVFFVDLGLKKSQQIFADLNRYAIRPTKSLSILYDHRDENARLVIELIQELELFAGFVEMEKSTISNRSSKLFTLSAVYSATMELLNEENSSREKLASRFWNRIDSLLDEWKMVRKGQLSPVELRKEYISGHGIFLIALGRAGNQLIKTYPTNWSERLSSIKLLDRRKSNRKTWDKRTLVGGKVLNTRNNVTLTTNVIKKTLGLSLTEEEQAIEASLLTE